MPFGKPFFPSFNQVVPVINMQDLWVAPRVSDHFMSNNNYTQDQQEALHNPEMDCSVQQQQY